MTPSTPSSSIPPVSTNPALPTRLSPAKQIAEVDHQLVLNSAHLAKLGANRTDRLANWDEIQKLKAANDHLLDRRIVAMKLRDRRGRLTRAVHSNEGGSSIQPVT